MPKFSVLQTTTILEQIRWNVEAQNLEEAIEKVKNQKFDDAEIDEEQTITKDISFEGDEILDF